MEYRSEFGKLAFCELKPGELFRFFGCNSANMKGPMSYTSLANGVATRPPESGWKPHEEHAQVVLIRIDRVEDGLPVFVDA